MAIFMFTDIEGSTRLWQQYATQMPDILARHDALLRQAIERFGGSYIKNTGDGAFAVFESGDPLGCAVYIQSQVASEDWGEPGELRLRIALHAGQAERRGEDYFGLDVTRASRLLSAGWGGQILLTSAAAQTCAEPPGSSLVDHGTHQLRDLYEPLQIYELRHSDLPPRAYPALHTLAAHPHNLPTQPTPFVGRARDLDEISAQLEAPDCRLLTLSGPGGIGKTRLALQVAARQVGIFEDGVYFTPLAPLSDSENIIPAIAEALRFSFYSREPVETQLLRYLQDKHLLLILDNFEHILEGVEIVSRMLAQAPAMKILVTSRERLNLRQEQVYEVQGMLFPAGSEEKPLESYSAVGLFLQSARRVDPNFILEKEEVPCLLRVCQLVGGMPLGIELAGAWIRLLTCQEIAAEIAASLDFLTTTLRDVPERHRSLRAAFEYSWKLLSATERGTLSRLAVFHGGFDRQAAAQVCNAALLQLAALVDKSLLYHHPAGGRYHMHPAIAQYAAEKLVEMGQQELVAQQHCDYYALFLSKREAALHGAGQKQALEEIAAEIENLRAAWDWALAHSRLEAVRQATHSLADFYFIRSWFAQGAQAMEHAARAFAISESQLEAASALRLAVLSSLLAQWGRFLLETSLLEEAQPLLEQSLSIARRLDQPGEIAQALAYLGRAAWLDSDYNRSRAQFDQALSFARRSGDLHACAEALNGLGVNAWALGEFSLAEQCWSESLQMYQQADNQLAMAACLDLLGAAARDQSNLEKARQHFDQSLKIFRQLGARHREAFACNHLGGVIGMLGDPLQAIYLLKESIHIARELGDQRLLGFSLCDLGAMARETGQLEQARQWLEEGSAIFKALGDQFGQVLGMSSLGGLLIVLGEYPAAAQNLNQALSIARQVHNPRLVDEVLYESVPLFEKLGENLAALRILAFLSQVEELGAERQKQARTRIERLAADQPGWQTGKEMTIEEAADLLHTLLDRLV